MQFLVFILVYPFIYLISFLPFRLLYALSDFLSFITFHVIGYRKKVIYNNLRTAFPEKSEKEIKEIQKKFYHHFVDIFMEMIKIFTISKKEFMKRVSFTNEEELKTFMKKYPSNILMASHHSNYEWLSIIKQHFDHPFYVAYKQVENKYFDNLAKKSRSRFGSTLIPTRQYRRLMNTVYKKKESGTYGLISDQNPLPKKAQYWRSFFGKRVPVFTGAEKFAKEYNYPVAYVDTRKIKRGYYQATFKVITENPRELPDYQITDKFFEILENQIREQPEYYFWTHKRFKHVGKEPSAKKNPNKVSV
ncbi:MAG: lipid A biosynthesis acyltransferase [Flavobacteriia bacterium]|nr:MAG: lipid A biosynthesis acyltransferase [Flavobacteriia bacterium]